MRRCHPGVSVVAPFAAISLARAAHAQTFTWLSVRQTYLNAAQAQAMSRDGSALVGYSCCSIHDSEQIGFMWRRSSGMSDSSSSWDGYHFTAVGPTTYAG